MSDYQLTPTTALEPGESVRESFRPDRTTYIRDHAWLAALAMGVGMVILWLMGNPYVWTGAVGGLAAIVVRGWYVASDELGARWDLTERRLLGPGTRVVPLGRIDKVRTIASAVQVVTIEGEKHLIRYQADPGRTRAAIEAARG
ncbi:hypothetical protein [Histidinibacterium lentulum]|uniref:DUF304 domain-containing protein n=1 Tax=Histidinibacterium lentulum TaxID=2480588 RepID=A0A3N2R4Z6_9RHOB|nr:hypothetical protein [Histidinibacterium lentulum]ROU02565.1 hypothetical protein EAT49_09545 [Histidinibacterium lentulum]